MKSLLKKSLVVSFIATCLFSLSSISADNKKVIDNKKIPSIPSPEPSKLKINSDEATYDRKNKKALAKGHVKITQDNTVIYTSEVLYDDNNKISQIDDFVRIIQTEKEDKRKTDISANKMIAYHQQKKIHMEDTVRFDREEERVSPFDDKKKPTKNGNKTEREKIENAVQKERTVITSDSVDYWTKTGNAIFTGKGVVLQRNKKAYGDLIEVKNDESKNTDTIRLEGNAKLIQIKGDWLVKEGIIKIEGDKEKERFVKEKLEMNAETITIFQKQSKIIGDRKVRIVQDVSNKHREATGDNAVYDDITKNLVLIGNVRIKRDNGDWLSAEKAIFHTDSENFEAFSNPNPDISLPPNVPKKQVETEFTIPDEDKKDPEPPINSPAPDINLDEGKNNKKEKPKAIPSIIPSVIPSLKNNNQLTPSVLPSSQPKAIPTTIPSLPAPMPSIKVETKGR